MGSARLQSDGPRGGRGRAAPSSTNYYNTLQYPSSPTTTTEQQAFLASLNTSSTAPPLNNSILQTPSQPLAPTKMGNWLQSNSTDAPVAQAASAEPSQWARTAPRRWSEAELDDDGMLPSTTTGGEPPHTTTEHANHDEDEDYDMDETYRYYGGCGDDWDTRWEDDRDNNPGNCNWTGFQPLTEAMRSKMTEEQIMQDHDDRNDTADDWQEYLRDGNGHLRDDA